MVNVTINGKDYELKVTTRVALDMEEALGTNPVNIMLRVTQSNELPAFKDLLVMFHHALRKFNHGLSFKDTLELFDRYVDEGGSIIDLLQLLVEAFKESGLIREEEEDPNL